MLAVKELSGSPSIFGRDIRLMGIIFRITVVAKNNALADDALSAAEAEIARVEKLLSTFTDDSQLNQINGNAGLQPVKVDAEVFRLIDRAVQISELTYGTFDITYNNNDGKSSRKKLSNYKNILLNADAQTVLLKNKGMRISFATIARGYATDRAKYALQMAGVSSGVINTDGDLLSWGLQPDNTPWTIGAADPSQANEPYADVDISNMAISTSYTAEAKPVAAGSIDPANGFPISQIKSVSIITPGAELADALARPVVAMGINAGLYLINKLNQIACVIIDDHARVYTSKGINLAL